MRIIVPNEIGSTPQRTSSVNAFINFLICILVSSSFCMHYFCSTKKYKHVLSRVAFLLNKLWLSVPSYGDKPIRVAPASFLCCKPISQNKLRLLRYEKHFPYLRDQYNTGLVREYGISWRGRVCASDGASDATAAPPGVPHWQSEVHVAAWLQPSQKDHIGLAHGVVAGAGQRHYADV